MKQVLFGLVIALVSALGGYLVGARELPFRIHKDATPIAGLNASQTNTVGSTETGENVPEDITPEEFREVALRILKSRIESASAFPWSKQPGVQLEYVVTAQLNEYALIGVLESHTLAEGKDPIEIGVDEFRVFPRTRRIDWRRLPIEDFYSFQLFVEDSAKRESMREAWACKTAS